jgi:hypothetical protein
MATNVQQLLLQVDASVELARRNIASLATQVTNDTGKMQTALDRVDALFDNFGKGLKANAAEQSAQAFIKGFEAAEASAKKLLAAVDPLFAAEQRYIDKMEEANNLRRVGAMTYDELERVSKGLRRAFDEEAAALGRTNKSYDEHVMKFQQASKAAEEYAAEIMRLKTLERDALEGNIQRTAIASNTDRTIGKSARDSASVFSDSFKAAEGVRALAQAERDAVEGAMQLKAILANTDLTGGKSAKESAAAFELLAKAEQDAAMAASRLIAQYDPLYAAQARYNQKLAEAERLRDQGAMDDQRLIQIKSALQKEYDETAASLNGTAIAAQRLAQEENELSASAERLKARLDPLYAAQQRHSAAINEAERLLQAGKISWTVYGQAVDQAAHELMSFQQAAAGTNNQMNAINRTSGQMRLGMQNLSFQINDIATMMALGARPQQIFASQAGQVVAAMQMMGHEGNKWVRFLGGPWGIALSLAISGLALFSMKNKEADESVAGLIKKMEKQEAQAYKQEIANKVWENSIQGVIDRQRELNEELDKEKTTPLGQNRASQIEAQNDLKTQRDEVVKLEKRIATLKTKVEDSRDLVQRLSGDPDDRVRAQAVVAAVQLSKLEGQLKAAQEKLAMVNSSILKTEQNIRDSRARVIREEAKASWDVSGFYDGVRVAASKAASYSEEVADAIEAVARASEAAAEKAPGAVGDAAPKVVDLVQSLQAGTTTAAQFAKAMNGVAKAVEAAGEAAKKSKVGGGLPKVTQADGQALIKEFFGADTRITSTTRTPKQNKDAGGAANSYHLQNGRALAIDFVPKGGIKAFDKEMLRLAAEAKGMTLLEILGPGDKGHDDHGHIAVALKRLGPDQVAKAQQARANKENAEAQRKNMRELAVMRFGNGSEERLEDLNAQLIAATMELVDNTELQAEYSRKLVESQFLKVQKDIENDAAEAKKAGLDASIVDAKTAELKAANEKVRDQKLANIEVRKQLALAKEANDLERQRNQFKQDGLRFDDEMANNRLEHLRIQLEILDLVYAQRERDLEYAKLQAERNGNIAEANRIQEEINNLPAERSRDRARTERQNESPFEAWKRDAADTTDELESLRVQGIEGLVDTLVAAKDGWEAMRKVALAAIQDILTQLIRMQTMKMIANLFGTAAGSMGGGGGAGFSMGASPLPGPMPDFGGISLGGFKDGGLLKGPGTGTSDSIPLWGSNGEFMVNAEATKKYLPMLEMINSGRGLKFARGGLIGGISVPKAANINLPSGGGDTYHIRVDAGRLPVPPAERRRTGAQMAAGMQERIARTKRRGM